MVADPRNHLDESRNVPSRLGSSSVIVVGIAGVVGVLVAILSMATGFRLALNSTGKRGSCDRAARRLGR